MGKAFLKVGGECMKARCVKCMWENMWEMFCVWAAHVKEWRGQVPLVLYTVYAIRILYTLRCCILYTLHRVRCMYSVHVKHAILYTLWWCILHTLFDFVYCIVYATLCTLVCILYTLYCVRCSMPHVSLVW